MKVGYVSPFQNNLCDAHHHLMGPLVSLLQHLGFPTQYTTQEVEMIPELPIHLGLCRKTGSHPITEVKQC